ncbi:MAG: SCO family protein, partial [Methylococcales bacterium]|nr:SCO family protein [Methylococcales bacterium]
QLHGFAMESPAPIGNFTLTDHNGEQVSISDYRGKIVLLYFGYTHCPDVCPATMSDLARAYDSLKQKQQDDVQIFMVTVDPERDTPELLGRYLNNFNPNCIGLTGSREEIDAAAAPLGIFYEINKVDGASAYLVDHTASVAVLDKRGYLRLVWPFGVGSEEVASDLKYFLRE